MAEERDPQVSKRYRELGAEEPPRALDEAILAASRRAVDSRPAPLVVPAGRRRWYFPVAAAAVITLAVAVTVQIERQRPDEATVATAPPPPRTQEQAAPQAKEQKVEPFAQKAPARAAGSRATDSVAASPVPATPPAQAAPPPQPAPLPKEEAPRDLAKAQAEVSAARSAEAPAPRAESRADSARGRAGPAVAAAMASPESLLEQIAEMRRQGRHEEADKALEEFRKRYPDYRLSDEMKAKVERK